MPAMRLIGTPRQQHWQRNNHFVLSYCEEQWQQQTNARGDQADSHATIKNSCCCSQDGTATVPRNARISSTNMPRLSTVSTPKKACKHAEDGLYITKVRYVAKGKYIEYAKNGMYVANSEHSKYAVRGVFCPRRVWRVRQRRTDPHGIMTMSSHATTVLISEADNIVPCNDQTPLLSLSTKSVKLRPQINQIEVDWLIY